MARCIETSSRVGDVRAARGGAGHSAPRQGVAKPTAAEPGRAEPGRAEPAAAEAGRTERSRPRMRPAVVLAWAGYVCGWAMLTSQETPNRSVHMPNSSPQTCFCSGMIVVPAADSFSQ